MSNTMNNNAPDIKAVSMQLIVKRLGSVMDAENILQLSLSKGMDNFRSHMSAVAKDMTEVGNKIATEQKVLQVLKVVLTIVMIATLVVTLATIPLSVGTGMSTEIMAPFVDKALSAVGLFQGGSGIASGGGTIAEGGIDCVKGNQMSYAAKLKALSSSLSSQLDSISKTLDGSSEASKRLAEATGQIIENNYRAQIITNNLI